MEPSVYMFILTLLFCSAISRKVTKDGHSCGKPLGTDYLLENERIVAGYDVGYYRYPWFAALVQSGQISCGAALIGPRTVITAAHCYKDYLNRQGFVKLEDIYTVKLGVYNICTTEEAQREYKIQKVQIHELYKEKMPYYDVCLLTLANDTKEYEPICLPNTYVKNKPKDGTVPGLGTLRYQGALPCTVHEARILIYPDDECRHMINNTGNDANAVKNAFCAGYLQGGIDTCQGDSGGPLQVLNENGDFVLLGIVSFGFHCAMPGMLGMYTDISEYLDWIEEKSGLNPNTIIYNKNKTSTVSSLNVPHPSVNTKRPVRKHPFKRPYWRPIKVIIIKNHKIVVIRRPVLHKPIRRYD